MLGHEADEREYSLAACILEDLGVASVQLMTNNPLKISALQASGIKVSSRVSLEAPVNADNKAYLLAKATRMDHMLDMSQNERNIKATTTANVSAREKNESEPAN